MLVSVKPMADFSMGCAGKGIGIHFSRPTPTILPFANSNMPAFRVRRFSPQRISIHCSNTLCPTRDITCASFLIGSPVTQMATGERHSFCETRLYTARCLNLTTGRGWRPVASGRRCYSSPRSRSRYCCMALSMRSPVTRKTVRPPMSTPWSAMRSR